jgi:toxin-antitoxin system PIN domain toxin
VILADVNVLVYAFDEESRAHEKYRSWLIDALSDRQPFALVDSVLTGFVRIVTDSRIFHRPAHTADALSFVGALVDSPISTWIPSNRPVWDALGQLVDGDNGINGKRVPDAYLAALAIANGARLATADRGFSRYPGLAWFDPAARTA